MIRLRAVLVCIIASALGLRLIGLRYGLPYVYNPDEVAIMSRALAFAKGDLNPHNFLYPSFYFYVLFAWEALTATAAIATRAVASFGAFQREFFLDPTRVYVAGRLLTALCGTATVAAVYALGRRVAGSICGVAAAIAIAVSPLHVRDSHYVKHDVPVTLLIVLAYLAYERLWNVTDKDLPPKGGSHRTLIVAAALTGVAFSTHYYAIFLAIPLAWSAARRYRGIEALRRIALAAIVSAAVFFLLSPFILAEPAIALRDMRANRQIVIDRAVESLGYGATVLRYADMLVRDTLGWPLIVLSLGGLAIALARRPKQAFWLLAFPVPFFLFIAGTYPASRYLIPLVPFLAIFAGVLTETFARRSQPLAWAAIGVAALLPFIQSVRTDLFIRQTDTRTLAADFIRAHVPDGATVLTQPYSVPLEPTRGVLQEAVARSGREMPTKTRLQLERNPYPVPAYRIVYLGRGMDVDKLYVPYDELDSSNPIRTLERERVTYVVLKRYNDPNPATESLVTALAREGRRIAVFSPYRRDVARRPEPFQHNTDARIDPALERPGPIVEIWQIPAG
jgi:dolichyl-phosphate-mannose-protein mannosyltransferase